MIFQQCNQCGFEWILDGDPRSEYEITWGHKCEWARHRNYTNIDRWIHILKRKDGSYLKEGPTQHPQLVASPFTLWIARPGTARVP